MFKEDFKKLVPISENLAADTAAVNLALAELAKVDLVTRDSEVWVLRRKFNSFTQTLELAAPVCTEIARIVNTADENGESNAAKITEGNIISLIQIIYSLSNQE